MRLVFNNHHAELLESPALQAPTTGTCMIQAPILTLNPTQINAENLTETGTITATIKNNNIGNCGNKTFTLDQALAGDWIDAYMTDNTLSLSSQQSGEIEIHYELNMEADSTDSLTFVATQVGEDQASIRGIVFDATQAGPGGANSNALKDTNAANLIQDGSDTPPAGSAGCHSQHAPWSFYAWISLVLFLFRKKTSTPSLL
jgi:hypothetical protein